MNKGSTLSADEARRILDANVAAIKRRKRVPLAEAVGRVLAEPFRATEDIPPVARAVMDGFAVRSADVAGAAESQPVWLAIVGRVVMGETWRGTLKAGEAVAIPTGGTLPDGADAVVMIEHSREESDSTSPGTVSVAILRPVEEGRNVIHAGEDIGRGALVVPAGCRLSPREVGAFAAFGVGDVMVYGRPRVALVSTGAELVAGSLPLRPGQVRDINQPVLAAAAALAGAKVTSAGVIDDDPAAITSRVATLLPDHDMVILSGGSSVGGKDFTEQALGALGEAQLLFHGINVRPGRPTLAVRAGDKLIVGLPGVPASALVIFHAFVRPLLWRFAGEADREAWPSRRRARLARGVVSAAGREDYLRVRLEERDGDLWAEPLPGGSAALGSVLNSDGLLVVPAACEAIEAGAWADVCLWS